VAASPIALYASYLFLGDGPEPDGLRLPVIAGFTFMFAGLLVLPAAFLLRIKDLFNLLRSLRADLENRRVECFSLPTLVDSGAKLEDTSALGDLGIKSLEVFPYSRLLFLVDGSEPPQRKTVNVYEAMAPPEDPPPYALPRELATVCRMRFRSAQCRETAHYPRETCRA